jgi:hypothetical protein
LVKGKRSSARFFFEHCSQKMSFFKYERFWRLG